MPKTAVFTTITPLPAGITRKSVLDMFRDHLAMIDLNPLVVERFKCKPPSYAPTDEYWSTWYTIKDKVSYLPGGLAQGSVSYHACFNDLAEGLQTHVYAPLNLDIEGRWSVGGRLPGEPKPPTEVGLPTPRHGLYIREDVKMTCSTLLMRFVRKTFKDSHARLVEKLVERAHILESNFANERLQALRNVDPGERMGHGDIFIAPPPDYQSPGCAIQSPLPRYISHLRSQSDSNLSPRFSSTSTLIGRTESPLGPSKNDDRPISFKFILEEKPISSSAPEPTSFLLPATTYNGGLSQGRVRSQSLYPGSVAHHERVISLIPLSPPQSPEYMQAPMHAPRVSYTPEERPITFTFPFDPQSPFDKRSDSEIAQANQEHLLDDIDDAIDEVFMYTLPATKYTTLPSTSYEPAEVLPKVTYDLRHERKDSFMPTQEYLDKALPPVPLEGEKIRR